MAITLLLADDHQLVRQSLISLLEHEGFEVVGEASDGRTAVRLVQDLQPEIAVLDMVMPGLNGIDAARQIQRASPRTKSILVTMYVKLARREEREVLVEFGEKYRRYMNSTPAFFPRLRATRWRLEA